MARTFGKGRTKEVIEKEKEKLEKPKPDWIVSPSVDISKLPGAENYNIIKQGKTEQEKQIEQVEAIFPNIEELKPIPEQQIVTEEELKNRNLTMQPEQQIATMGIPPLMTRRQIEGVSPQQPSNIDVANILEKGIQYGGPAAIGGFVSGGPAGAAALGAAGFAVGIFKGLMTEVKNSDKIDISKAFKIYGLAKNNLAQTINNMNKKIISAGEAVDDWNKQVRNLRIAVNNLNLDLKINFNEFLKIEKREQAVEMRDFIDNSLPYLRRELAIATISPDPSKIINFMQVQQAGLE